ncbi:MAG: disulfide bond formation protein B [Rickettsiales bacterium]|jgi:disulfide bond formation protein DsbB|nr:disulfide bond formation protein B [Rickettsiales bacterium]
MLLNAENYLKYSLILIIALLSSVFIMQFGFDILPCKLCLIQRYPYYLLLAILAFYHFLKLNKFKRLVLFLTIIFFMVAALIALYHSLVELNLISTDLHCVSASIYGNLQDMQNSIIDKPAVSCDVAAFKILFLSLSNWNFLISFFYGLLGFIVISRK